MANIADLIKKIPNGEQTAITVKSAILKFALDEKLTSSTDINEICKVLRTEQGGLGFIQYLVLHNHSKLLELFLSLLDKNKNSEIAHVHSERTR